jgi:hypothetical protein
MDMNQESARIREQHPHPGADPAARLRHTLDLFGDDARDDKFVVVATSGIYGRGETTGLTWGDLRAIAQRVGCVMTQSDQGGMHVVTDGAAGRDLIDPAQLREAERLVYSTLPDHVGGVDHAQLARTIVGLLADAGWIPTRPAAT